MLLGTRLSREEIWHRGQP